MYPKTPTISVKLLSLDRVLFFTLFLLVCAVRLSSQQQSRNELTFPAGESLYADVLHRNTSDSGSITIFQTYTTNNIWYINLVKTSANGNTQWAKRLTSSGAYDEIVPLADSGYLLCYTFNQSYYLLRLDAGGNTIYSKQINVPAPCLVQTRAPHVIPKANGGCYIVGDVIDNSNANGMWHVFELDANGNAIWSHAYHQGFAKAYHTDVDTCSNGDLVILGVHFDIPNSHFSPLITRIAPGGNVVWSNYYTVPFIGLIPKSLVVMSGDEIVVAAVPSTFGPLTHLMRCDGQGNVLWNMQFQRPSNMAMPTDLMTAENNTTVVWGLSNGGSMMIKNDTAGAVLCLHDYPGVNVHRGHTLNGQWYSATGETIGGSSITAFTTDLCGHTCQDSTFKIMENVLTTIVTARISDTLMPVVVVAFVPTMSPVNLSFQTICIGTDIDQLAKPEFHIYPVPATDQIRVESENRLDNAELIDVQGKVVLTKNLQGARTATIQLPRLANGIYLLRISDSVGVVMQRKILIQQDQSR